MKLVDIKLSMLLTFFVNRFVNRNLRPPLVNGDTVVGFYLDYKKFAAIIRNNLDKWLAVTNDYNLTKKMNLKSIAQAYGR